MKVSVQDWSSNFDRLADELWAQMHEVASRSYFRAPSPQPWQPALNVYEAPDRIIVCAELPGMAREEIDVQFAEGVLHIGGVRPKPVMEEMPATVGVVLMEIDSGPFRRCVEVSLPIHVEAIRAYYRRGYLWVTLPCAPQSSEGI